MIRQRGVALLTALLIVALVTIIAATIAERLQLDLRRVQNQQQFEQAFQYALGLEAVAKRALDEDSRLTPQIDSNAEPWAQPLPPLPVDGGLVTARMSDLDGRFNLNNLVVDDRPQPLQIDRFRRLLSVLELNPSLAEAVVDWVDQDGIVSASGAEDSAYARLRPAYRAANQPFSHPSELRLVKGFEADTVRRLLPYITALPSVEQPTPINVNTALPAVLQSLHTVITPEIAETLYQNGRAQWPRIDVFLEHPLLYQRAQIDPRSISVNSKHFLINSNVELDGRLQHFSSVLIRQRRGLVTWRSRSPYQSVDRLHLQP